MPGIRRFRIVLYNHDDTKMGEITIYGGDEEIAKREAYEIMRAWNAKRFYLEEVSKDGSPGGSS